MANTKKAPKSVTTKAKGKAAKSHTEVNQDNLKAFAFPTRKSVKAAVKAVERGLREIPVTFEVDDLVAVKTASTEYATVVTVPTMRSKNKEYWIKYPNGETKAVHGSDLVLVGEPEVDIDASTSMSADSRRQGMSPAEELESVYGLNLGNIVKFKIGQDSSIAWTISGVIRDPDNSLWVALAHDAKQQTVLASSVEHFLPVVGTSGTKPKSEKVAFRDLNLLQAFSIRERTFVKVGNSTAIAAHVKGDAVEPFAMLSTSNSKPSKDAKQRFKQTDKVMPYQG